MLISLNSRAHRELVAEFVRLRKEVLDMNQRDFAKKLKTSQSYVAQIEKGQKHIPLFGFAPYCRALGVDPVDMFVRYCLR